MKGLTRRVSLFFWILKSICRRILLNPVNRKRVYYDNWQEWISFGNISDLVFLQIKGKIKQDLNSVVKAIIQILKNSK